MVLLTLYRIFIYFFECVITAYLHNMMKNEDAGIFLVYYSLKVAVNTIVPRSPFFFVFVPQNPDCYTHQKKRGRISPSMEWRYLCYLQLVSKAKHSLTPMAKEEVCPRDEIADPPGMAVLPIDIYGFDEGLVSFRTLCGVQSSLVRFAPNQAIDWGPLQWQAWLETLCLSSASS